MTKLERKLKEWKVIGVFKTKDELMDKAKKEWILSGFKKIDVEYTLEYYNEMLKFNENEEYAINLKYLDIDIYSKVIEYEKEMLKNEQKEAKERRKAQQSMSIDDYRIVQKQQQAEYLVKREMKRMAKMVGRKNLLSYEPKVYVLHTKNWKESNTGGYVNSKNQIFLPEHYFKKKHFYDPNKYGLKKIIYRKNEKIVKIIRHELTHLFVREQYKNACVLNVEGDASPIFLYYLAFFEAGFGNGYKVQTKYEKELCEEIQCNMNYLSVRDKCNRLLNRIEMMFENCPLKQYITFTKDSEISYVGENLLLNLGYDVVNYNIDKFTKLNSEWSRVLLEKTKEEPNAKVA